MIVNLEIVATNLFQDSSHAGDHLSGIRASDQRSNYHHPVDLLSLSMMMRITMLVSMQTSEVMTMIPQSV